MSSSYINSVECGILKNRFRVHSDSSIPFGIPDKVQPFINKSIKDDLTPFDGFNLIYRKEYKELPLIHEDDFKIDYMPLYFNRKSIGSDKKIRLRMNYCAQSLELEPNTRTGHWIAEDLCQEWQYLDTNGFFFIFSLIHLLNDGLALHGVGFDYLNRGIVCLGSSGVGKSTIYQMLKDRVTFYGDDGIFIQKLNDSFMLVPSPFYQYDINSDLPSYPPVPMKLCLLLQQDTKTFLEVMPIPDWVLISQLEFFFHFVPFFQPIFGERIKNSLHSFIQQIPCYVLHFSNREFKILEVINNFLSGRRPKS